MEKSLPPEKKVKTGATDRNRPSGSQVRHTLRRRRRMGHALSN